MRAVQQLQCPHLQASKTESEGVTLSDERCTLLRQHGNITAFSSICDLPAMIRSPNRPIRPLKCVLRCAAVARATVRLQVKM
jgi:hypothetical protein